MGISFWQILLVVLLVVLLFGRGKISDLMGDMAKGIRSFKKGLTEDEPSQPEASPPQKSLSDERTSNGAQNDRDSTKSS